MAAQAFAPEVAAQETSETLAASQLYCPVCKVRLGQLQSSCFFILVDIVGILRFTDIATTTEAMHEHCNAEAAPGRKAPQEDAGSFGSGTPDRHA